MRLLIIGGSGRTGQLIIEEALGRNQVTALIRDPNSVQARPGLTVVKGSPLNKADVERAFAATPGDSPEAVIVALNSTRATDNLSISNPNGTKVRVRRLTVYSMGVAIMKEYGVSKIVTMSAFGTAESFPNLNFLMRLVIKKSNMLYAFQDHDLVDQEMKESGVDFVLARPVMLTDKEAQPIREHGNSGEGSGFMPAISQRSVAKFLVGAAEKNNWNKSTPVISN